MDLSYRKIYGCSISEDLPGFHSHLASEWSGANTFSEAVTDVDI